MTQQELESLREIYGRPDNGGQLNVPVKPYNQSYLFLQSQFPRRRTAYPRGKCDCRIRRHHKRLAVRCLRSGPNVEAFNP
jgi:hypothetical protein